MISPVLDERLKWTVSTEYQDVWAQAGVVREEDLEKRMKLRVVDFRVCLDDVVVLINAQGKRDWCRGEHVAGLALLLRCCVGVFLICSVFRDDRCDITNGFFVSYWLFDFAFTVLQVSSRYYFDFAEESGIGLNGRSRFERFGFFGVVALSRGVTRPVTGIRDGYG